MNKDLELILGNSNPRFSGVTSTMLQTLEHQKHLCRVGVLGKHHLTNPELNISFLKCLRIARERPKKSPLVFHARRNDEMIQALILRDILRANLKIAFTSTAQRHHSSFSRWLMNKMDGIISTCDAAASFLEKKPNVIIPHGVDSDRYYPAKNKKDAWSETGLPGQRGIGIFGRVREQKGVGLFVHACIEVLPSHPEFTAIIVGAIADKDRDFVEALASEIKSAGLSERIIFLGEQLFERIPALMRAVSLVTALSYNEGYGLTVPEAMSSGTAVLATETGAWPEILNNSDAGTLVPTRDQVAVAGALDKLLSNTEKLDEMGNTGRQEVIDKYQIQKEAESLVNYLRSLSKQ